MLKVCYDRIMIDVTQDIHSLTTFKRKSSDLMKQMKKTGRPLVLTVNGKAEAGASGCGGLPASGRSTGRNCSHPPRPHGKQSRV